MAKGWILVIAIILILSFFASSLYLYLKPRSQTEEDNIATKLLNDVLHNKYLPASMKMVNKLTSGNRTDGEDKLYGLIWYVDSEMFYTSIFYNDLNKSGISNFNVFILANDVPDSLNGESASLLFDQYFKVQSQGEVKCDYDVLDSNSKVAWCEKFWEGPDENKMGMVAVNSPANKFIGFCEYPTGSVKYELSSCIQWPKK